jgi:hypothetical protein
VGLIAALLGGLGLLLITEAVLPFQSGNDAADKSDTDADSNSCHEVRGCAWLAASC